MFNVEGSCLHGILDQPGNLLASLREPFREVLVAGEDPDNEVLR